MNKKNVFLASTLVLTFLVLIPTLRNGWTNLDDPIYILENSLIRELSWESIKVMFTTLQVNGSYNPLVLLSWAIDYSLFEFNPLVYHSTNLFLHLIVVALVYYFTLKLSKNRIVAFLTSLLFGIHPMHVEAVAWVTARKDLLYTVFYFAGLIMYYFYQEKRNHSSKWKFLILCFIFYILSLFSKGSALTFPLVLWLIDYLNKRRDLKGLLLEKIPFFILSIVFTYISIKAQEVGEALQFREFYSVLDSLSVGFYGYLDYLIKVFVPYRLSALHPYPTPSGEPVPWFFTAAAIPVLVLFAFCVFKIKKNRPLVFGFGFFFITLIPVIQVLSFAVSVTADRFTYLPYFGLFYILSIGIVWVLNHRPKFIILIKISVVSFLFVLSVMTFSYSLTWKNSETIWSRVIKYYPDYFVSYVNRSAYRIKNDKLEEALEDCEKAIVLKPDYYLAYYNKGYIYSKFGNIEQAILNYTETIKFKNNSFQAYQNRGILYSNLNRFEDAYSDFNNSILIQPNNPIAYLNRATLLKNNQRHEEAIIDATKAVSIDDGLLGAYYVRAISFKETGQFQKAFGDFNKVIIQDPTMANAYTQRGILYFNEGKNKKALNDFNNSIKLDESQLEAYICRSKIMMNQSLFIEALFNLSRVEQKDPENYLIYLNRGIIYQNLGDYNTALKEITKGLNLYPEDPVLKEEKDKISKALNAKSE